MYQQASKIATEGSNILLNLCYEPENVNKILNWDKNIQILNNNNNTNNDNNSDNNNFTICKALSYLINFLTSEDISL